MNVTYTLLCYDAMRRLKYAPIANESHSFVKAFLQLLYCMTSNLSQNIIDIDNTSRAIDNSDEAELRVIHPGLASADDSGGGFRGNIGGSGTIAHYDVYADDCGIQVGTSSTAVAVADDNLVAPIANGTSASQFVYYGCWGLNYTTGASSASFDVERIFKNSSGGSIVVAEIGMYARAFLQQSPTASQAFGFCILRDVLGATVTVLNGEYLKVKYTITVSN